MTEPAPIQVDLRIPGTWSSPREMIERLPAGYRFTPRSLVLPDGTQIEFGAVDADDQFAQIFRSSCRKADDDELESVDRYTVNALLSGPGGSLDAARTMMQAGAALVQAGGAGVFIDNSALAHGGRQWLRMTEDGGPDALSFAFVSIYHSRDQVWTMGMHVLGLRDVIMKRVDADEFDIVEVIRYLAAGEKPVEDGHVMMGLEGPLFRVISDENAALPDGSPMYNPLGRLKLVSTREIADNN